MAEIHMNPSRGWKTGGTEYSHRYIDMLCPECGNGRAYIDRWHTRLSLKCTKRDCRHNWYLRRWLETPAGRKDTYIKYVGAAGVEKEDELRRMRAIWD